MKNFKIMAMLIVLVMGVILVVACNGETAELPATTTTDTPAVTDSAPPAPPDTQELMPEGGIEFEDAIFGEIGMFDPYRDYFAEPRFRFEYVVMATSTIAESYAVAYAEWALVANMEFNGLTEFANDADAFMMSLPAIAARNDGLIIDAGEQYNRAAEILDAIGIPWVIGMGVPLDMETEGFPLLHFYFGNDQLFVGEQLAMRAIADTRAMWPNIPINEFGFIIVDYSTSFALHQRTQGATEYITTNHPEFINENRFFIADTSISFWDVDTSRDVVSTVLAQNPQLENWIIFGIVESMAQGAALAVDAFGFEDTTYIIAMGAAAAMNMWDAGDSSAWRVAGSNAFPIVAEPAVFSLRALLMGETTPDTIWPEWVNCARGEVYASRLIPIFYLTQENYRQILAWTDVFAGTNIFPEHAHLRADLERDSFSARVRVPNWYRCWVAGCQFCYAFLEMYPDANWGD